MRKENEKNDHRGHGEPERPDTAEDGAHGNVGRDRFDHEHVDTHRRADQPHFQGDTIILIRSNDIHSRLATLHYQVYADYDELEEALSNEMERIQCIVGSPEMSNHDSVAFGSSQRPGLMDYADNVDTMSFLASL